VNLLIRQARPEDAPVLADIELDCFPDPSWDPEEFLLYACTIAEFEQRIVGFIVTQEVYRGVEEDPGECEILNLAVVPVARGLGVATALLNHVIRPGSHYFLEVRESNLAARNLYKKLGFSEVGSRPAYYDNPPETAIVMHRK
jgi:ribosomal protein S18 acetylase RimI-like enzyme